MITVEAAILTRAVAILAPLVPSKSTVPILQNLHFAANGQSMKITASNTEVWISCDVSAVGTGTFLLPGAKFAETLRKLPAGADLTIDVKPTMINLASGKIKFKFPLADARDYPTATDQDGTPIPIDPEAWMWALPSVSKAVNEESVLSYLTGVNVSSKVRAGRSLIALAATDSHRLCEAVIPCPASTEFDPITIPVSTIPHMMRALDMAEEAVLLVGKTVMLLTIKGVLPITLTSKLIGDAYPDYERIIPPAPPENIIRVDAAALREAIARATIYAMDKHRRILLTPVDGNAIDLTIGDPPTFDYSERIHVEHVGEPCAIAFNGPYLSEAITTTGAETVDIRITDEKQAALVLPGAGSAVAMLWVVMPLK